MSALAVPEVAVARTLDGQVAIVTGAGSAEEMPGSGAAIAILLAAAGATVALVDVDEARADHTRQAIAASGGSSEIVVGDITSSDECSRIVAGLVARHGRIDALVNNAAIAPNEDGRDDARWDRVIALNLTAAMLMTESVLPQMRTQGVGAIVNITSVAALAGGGGAAYSAAKAGLSGYGKAVAYREGRHGIRVNEVVPGHLAMPMGLGTQGGRTPETDIARVRRARASLLGTEGDAWDVAHACRFLVSSESRYITGASLPVDGGTTSVLPLAMAAHISTTSD